MATKRVSLPKYADYLAHKSRTDKFLREEHLPIRAVLLYKKIKRGSKIELGNETEPWDARVSGTLILEVTQALPEKEHEIRQNLASGLTKEAFLAHAADARQFPAAIVSAIRKKVDKCYLDNRTLIVAVSGAYTREDDCIIESWLPTIRAECNSGNFAEVLLVERDRQKVFKVF